MYDLELDILDLFGVLIFEFWILHFNALRFMLSALRLIWEV
jgi:hypothetical protein